MPNFHLPEGSASSTGVGVAAAQECNASGWLLPSDDFLRQFLQRPELALVAESCAAERALHDALNAAPSCPVPAADLQALQDADVRENYALFLRFRNALLAAGSSEAYYLELFPRDAGLL